MPKTARALLRMPSWANIHVHISDTATGGSTAGR